MYSPEMGNSQPRNYQFPAQKLPISSPEITNFPAEFSIFLVSFSSPEITNFQPRNCQFPAQKLPISSPEITNFQPRNYQYPAQIMGISSPDNGNIQPRQWECTPYIFRNVPPTFWADYEGNLIIFG